jgi:hypothetical protein
VQIYENNLNFVKILCNFQRMFTMNTALIYSFDSGQVGHCGYLIITLV